jgi:hypothetical protein
MDRRMKGDCWQSFHDSGMTLFIVVEIASDRAHDSVALPLRDVRMG